MFTRSSTAVVLALSVLATASVLPRNGPNSNQCNTGTLQCCNSVQSASSVGIVGLLLGLLGVDVESLTGQVGVTCSPITVVGASGTACSAQPACCSDNSFNGIIATGCSPVNLSL